MTYCALLAPLKIFFAGLMVFELAGHNDVPGIDPFVFCSAMFLCASDRIGIIPKISHDFLVDVSDFLYGLLVNAFLGWDLLYDFIDAAFGRWESVRQEEAWCGLWAIWCAREWCLAVWAFLGGGVGGVIDVAAFFVWGVVAVVHCLTI